MHVLLNLAKNRDDWATRTSLSLSVSQAAFDYLEVSF